MLLSSAAPGRQDRLSFRATTRCGATQDAKGVGTLKVFRTGISPGEIASLCGQPFTEVDIFEVGDEMGLKGAWNRYGRFEARLIIAKLMVRASDPQVLEHLVAAYAGLAAESDAWRKSAGAQAQRTCVDCALDRL